MTTPTTNTTWRLDKFLSHTTELSRSQAKSVIRKGHIRVDQHVVKDGSYVVHANQQVIYKQQTLKWPSSLYIMLNKPLDTVCALEDGQHQTVIDILPPADTRQKGFHIVGRLDLDTTGLLFLTTDGQWSHKITSPKHHCGKTYIVTTKQQISEDIKTVFEQGIDLHGERRKTSPAKVHIIDDFHCEITIYEGMYHQVKRMFASQGLTVVELHRVSIGGIHLDPALQPGEFRYLSDAEVEHVFHASTPSE